MQLPGAWHYVPLIPPRESYTSPWGSVPDIFNLNNDEETGKPQNRDVLKPDSPEISKGLRITNNRGKSEIALHGGRRQFINSQRQFTNLDWILDWTKTNLEGHLGAI